MRAGKQSTWRFAGVFVLLAGLAYAGPDAPGVGNFHQINDHLYRGAQPTALGFQSLAKLGVKTVVDLRESGGRSQAEEKIVTGLGMRYLSIPLSGYRAPASEQVSKLLALLDDSGAGPVFIHCRRGADRTGTIVACYRIRHDHWDNLHALQEAMSDGMSWLEHDMRSF